MSSGPHCHESVAWLFRAQSILNEVSFRGNSEFVLGRSIIRGVLEHKTGFCGARAGGVVGKGTRIMSIRLSNKLVLFFLLSVLAFAQLGCTGGAKTPQKVLSAYADAVESGDAGKAYDLLSAEHHERVNIESFEQGFTSSSKAAEILRKSADEGATIGAKLPFTDFDTVELQLTENGWVISGGLFHFYGQRTPREALVSFIRAVERRKYDVVMRFIPKQYAQHMSEDMLRNQFEENPAETDDMIARLKENKDNRINVQGDRATMKYGDHQVDFLKEDGLWKIEDPD